MKDSASAMIFTCCVWVWAWVCVCVCVCVCVHEKCTLNVRKRHWEWEVHNPRRNNTLAESTKRINRSLSGFSFSIFFSQKSLFFLNPEINDHWWNALITVNINRRNRSLQSFIHFWVWVFCLLLFRLFKKDKEWRNCRWAICVSDCPPLRTALFLMSLS